MTVRRRIAAGHTHKFVVAVEWAMRRRVTDVRPEETTSHTRVLVLRCDSCAETVRVKLPGDEKTDAPV